MGYLETECPINKMKKNIILYYILVAFVFIFIFIVIFERPKKFISRLIFSHELSLLTHSVFNEINNQIDFDMTKKENNKKSLIILNNYVFDFFKPVFNNLDDGASWKMLHGSIWCDGVADIFLRLAENTNTRVAMVILYDNEKNPLHSLNFADLDNSVNNFDENSELNKMYLFDPQNNYFPINNKFDFVNVIYMIKNKIEFSGYDILDSNNIKLNLLENNKKVFHKNRTFKEYSTIGKLSLKIVTIFPPIIFKTIYKFGIYINPELDDDYKKFLYARLDHILLDYNDAKIKYFNINNKNIYKENAQFWLNRINSSQSVLKNYEDIKVFSQK